MSDSIFTKIYQGEIPSEILFQDDIAFVIKDINPKAKTHLLIIPIKPIHSIMGMDEGDEEIVGHLFKIAKEMGQKLELPGYKLQINVGAHGGQEVFHLHIHLLANF